jgi:osmoprotectant transport system ATP-binding protein
VPQGIGLFPHLTAIGNIGFPARCRGWEDDKIDQHVHNLCELFAFNRERLFKYPAHLSRREHVLVGLMRALLMSPGVLVLDEPLDDLDSVTRFRIQSTLCELFPSLGATVILSTLAPDEMANDADQIVLLRAGRVVQTGTLSDLWLHPAAPFVTEFVQAQRSLTLSDADLQ